MDWLSSLNYNVGTTVPAGLNVAVPLVQTPTPANYDPAVYGGGDADVNPREFLVKRVVGQVYTSTPGTEDRWKVAWRLMGLPWDIGNGAFDTPWINTDPVVESGLNTDIVRWWAERYYWAGPTGVNNGEWGLETVDLAHYTFVDVEPKFLGGMHTGEWPAILCDNTMNDEEVTYYVRLRLLVVQNER